MAGPHGCTDVQNGNCDTCIRGVGVILPLLLYHIMTGSEIYLFKLVTMLFCTESMSMSSDMDDMVPSPLNVQKNHPNVARTVVV